MHSQMGFCSVSIRLWVFYPSPEALTPAGRIYYQVPPYLVFFWFKEVIHFWWSWWRGGLLLICTFHKLWFAIHPPITSIAVELLASYTVLVN